MINQTEVTIRLQHVSQGWFLWGEDDSGTPLSVTSWKRHAFTWHSTSFYGTFLKEATFEGKQGVLLTNAQAFEYIANKPMNSFAHIQLNYLLQHLQKMQMNYGMPLRVVASYQISSTGTNNHLGKFKIRQLKITH